VREHCGIALSGAMHPQRTTGCGSNNQVPNQYGDTSNYWQDAPLGGVLSYTGANSPGHRRMARLTITLTAERHRALREAAVQRGKTIGQLIEESLDFYGIKSARSAEALVARARARSGLTEKQALRLAVAETRAARRR